MLIYNLKLYAICFFSLMLVDFLWIGLFMKRFYVGEMQSIGRITGDKFEPVLWAAMMVYVVLSIAIVHFALPKISPEDTLISCFLTGALLGFVTYATYDFTNYSTLKDWTLALTFVDIAWGTFLGGLVTCIARFIRDT